MRARAVENGADAGQLDLPAGGAIAQRKKGGQAYKPNIPVILRQTQSCCGQPGKTPVVDVFYADFGGELDVHALSRRYGGALKGRYGSTRIATKHPGPATSPCSAGPRRFG